MVNIQEWLEQEHPNKNQVKIIEIAGEIGEELIEGELVISDFPHLEEIKKKPKEKKI